MEKIAKYQKYIAEILENYRTEPLGENRDASWERVIIDKENNHYQLMTIGWRDKQDRELYITVHVDIIDGKFWIQRDYTDPCITDQLLERGVPNDDIVLGFQPPYKRPYTDFALN